MAVTNGVGFNLNKQSGFNIDVIDVWRAYFHSKARRKVYVQLVGEDFNEGFCGKLLKAMYGTRDAAQIWEFEHNEVMKEIGFKRGLFNAVHLSTRCS